MRQATLHQLKVFEAVARHLSFTRAAEEMFLTQPTVSMQVKQLTQIMGLPLFEQLGKKLYLTHAGEALYSTCQTIFEQLADLDMQIADLKGLKKGRLRLAVVTTAKYFAPRLLGTFCHDYPGIDVSLQVMNRQQLMERLMDNRDDLYIMGQPPEDVNIIAAPFLDNPLVVLAPLDHPLVGESGISLARIAGEPWLMREPGSGTRMAIQRLLSQYGVSPRIRMELGSSEAIKQAVIGGLGISVLSRHVLGGHDGSGEVAILDVEGFPIAAQWYLVYWAGKHLSVVAQSFAEYLLHQGQHISPAIAAH